MTGDTPDLSTGPAPDVDDDDVACEAWVAALPELDAADMPAHNPADPEVDGFVQDDGDNTEVEGLGGFPNRPDHPVWRRAAERVGDKIRAGASNQIGYCLREIRTVNEVGSLYLCAADSMRAAEHKHRVADWSRVPRGAIVYFDSPSSRYGHIVESLGGGFVGSTDWPTARWGKVHGSTMKSAWGYTVAYWSPIVNDVRVWWPKEDRRKGPNR